MSSAAQVLRQAESLKATISESGKSIAELWVTRQRLEDLYKRLLLMDLEYALDKKVEQDLWNHAFKNQITTLQTQAKDKHNPKKSEVQANLNLFLETASGFYLQFLQLICSTFKLDLPFRRKSAAFGVMKEKCQIRAKITPPKKSSCLYICQYCLVHLGDIARYRQQVEQAQTFYRHAVNLSPQNGQPYNQLAILEVNRNNKLSSVFYYVRSLAVRHPFPVAATNLEKFYSKLIKDTSEFKGKMAQNEFVNAFLQFQALIHLSADFNRASYLCSRILSCLPAHLMSQTFSASVLVQCVAITIFTLNHVRHIPSGGDTNANFTNVANTKSAGSSGDGIGSGNMMNVNESVPKLMNQSEILLSDDEEKSIEILLRFTASVLELLVQHTPRIPSKARESPTLPAIQVLLQWLCHSPDIITSPIFCNSCLWGYLSKMLNTIQLMEDDKPRPNMAKYEEVPLPEDTELRCFQPIEKAHSKYSFSRIPVDGFPRGVEELVRCQRLVAEGVSIAEDFPELKMTFTQQGDPLTMHFSAPLPFKGNENSPSSQERRAKQNVAMQTIMKHGHAESMEVRGEKEAMCASQTSPKYLLGTITSEPQFMKHTASSGSLSSAGGSINNSGHLQSPPSAAQPSSAHPAQSSQMRGSSPFHGQSPRVASPMQSMGVSSLPPSPPQQQMQMSSVQVAQQKPLQQSKPQQQVVLPPSQLQSQQQQQQSAPFGTQGTFNICIAQPVNVRPSHPVSQMNAPATGSNAAHPFQGHLQNNMSFPSHSAPFQGHILVPNQTAVQSQGQMQGHPSQGQLQGHPGQSQSQNHAGQSQLGGHSGASHGQMQAHNYLGKGQGVPVVQGHLTEAQGSTKPGLPPAHLSQFQPFQMPFSGTSNEHFRTAPAPLGSPGVAGSQGDSSRMGQFQSGHGITGVSGTNSTGISQTATGAQNLHQNAAQLPLNPEMLSALRLASQISQHQQQALAHTQQMKMGGPLSHQQQQQQPLPSMSRAPIQRAPMMGQNPMAGPGPGSGPALGHFPGNLQQRSFSTGTGLSFPQAMRDPLQNSSLRHPNPHLQASLALGTQRGHDMGSSQMPRMPPPIPLPGQHALVGGGGFSSLSQPLFKDERVDGGRAFQTLSPLTIQPPKACPSDTRISTSFQGHAEGTPKPDKAETYAPDKREHEPVICRVEMPVAQPSGEYSLFASSSPWSMSLSSGGDSKSLSGSSQFSSQDSSLRNSPVVSFDSPTGQQYDALRYRGHVPEPWILQGSGYEEPKSRVQPPTSSLWSEASSMSPLERLLEQQRLQRQTDPH
ncbi:hypothetical protein C0Q70_18346 [Pomacea canaliculata]|uniref:DNA/RNA-binding domain-containing protein n=1 Tax=Pomacea canaliculata TaxID=400727 RepID=A0A2T7NMZ8_POMCA|nr:protein SMG7-like isoform X2 [Pomacea canaliculata]PVD22532.1 hypothetical protein C0Q70_18346 [Pomacea canaliculata]